MLRKQNNVNVNPQLQSFLWPANKGHSLLQWAPVPYHKAVGTTHTHLCSGRNGRGMEGNSVTQQGHGFLRPKIVVMLKPRI